MIGCVGSVVSPMPFPFFCCGSTSCVAEKVPVKPSNQMLITTAVAQKPVTFVVKAPPPPPETPENLYKEMSEKIARERVNPEPVVLERRIVVKEKSFLIPCILITVIISLLLMVFGQGNKYILMLEDLTKGEL